MFSLGVVIFRRGTDAHASLRFQAVIILSTLTAISLYVKKAKWSALKNRKLCTYHSLVLLFCEFASERD